MCGASQCIDNKRQCCCCSLRTCFAVWLVITGGLAFCEFFAGISVGGFTRFFTEFVRGLAREAHEHGAERAAHGFESLEDHAQRLSILFALLTSARGCIDILSLLAGMWGILARSTRGLGLFFAITILNCLIDGSIIAGTICAVIALDIADYAPVIMLAVAVFFGWRLVAGICVMAVLCSLIRIMQVGGTGGECLSYKEIVKAQKATKEALTAAEKHGVGEETAVAEESERKSLLKPAPTEELP